MTRAEFDQTHSDSDQLFQEIGLHRAEIYRFQQPIIVRRSTLEEAFPFLLKEPGEHEEEAEFFLLALDALYFEREELVKQFESANPKLSGQELERELKKNPDFNNLDGDIAFLQGSEHTNYAIELIEDEAGEIVGWAPELQEPPLGVEDRWMSIIRKNETYVAEYESLNESFPEGVEWCKKYLAARIKEHVFYESGVLEKFRAEYREYLKDDEDDVIGSRLEVLMSAISADFAAHLR